MNHDLIPIVVAVISGPIFIAADRLLTAFTNRARTKVETHRIEAQTGLALDQRWQAWADNLEDEVTQLKTRVTDLEASLQISRAREEDLKRVLRRVLHWALALRTKATEAGIEVPRMPDEVESALIYLEPSDTKGQ